MVAKIAVVGAGWWGQGWHIPTLAEHPDAQLVAIVDGNPHPKSTLNKLESLETLSTKYKVPIYSSIDEMLQTDGKDLDGVIVATSHFSHYAIAQAIYEYQKENLGRTIHILMEKPMTTELEHARQICQLVDNQHDKKSQFRVNHTANYRPQALIAKQHMSRIGRLRHITASFASPVMFIFEDPANKGWNEPTGTMLGNGFGWGQQSHLLAWIFFVCGEDRLIPEKVFCHMNHLETTGADTSHSASIICNDNVVMNISGTALIPGCQHAEEQVGKQIRIQIYGIDGALFYEGDDAQPTSGKLIFRSVEGSAEVLSDSFTFESVDKCPESVEQFIQLCATNSSEQSAGDNESLKDENPNCSNAVVGLRTVQTLEAMYRSHASQALVDVNLLTESS